MKARTRLTLLFTGFTAATLLLFAGGLFLIALRTGADRVLLVQLQYYSIIVWIIAVIISFLVARSYSRRALKLVSDMAKKAGEISATNLHLRLSERKDELHELAVTFNRMLDRLENSFDAQRAFVSNIAHELRTPLSAVIGELELALAKKDLPEEYRKTLESILYDARRLSVLSTGLMDMAKASYERHQVSKKPVRLDEVVMEARRDVLRNNPEYAIRVRLDEKLDEEDLITIHGNFYLLKVCIANLLDNACKFSGDKACTVAVHPAYDSRMLEMNISDKGKGIPEEELPYVMQPFYRGKNSYDNPGSGIGLSLSSKVIDLHDAKLEIQSTVDQGTTVRVLWPLY